MEYWLILTALALVFGSHLVASIALRRRHKKIMYLRSKGWRHCDGACWRDDSIEALDVDEAYRLEKQKEGR